MVSTPGFSTSRFAIFLTVVRATPDSSATTGHRPFEAWSCSMTNSYIDSLMRRDTAPSLGLLQPCLGLVGGLDCFGVGTRRNKTQAGRIAHVERAILAENIARAMAALAPDAKNEKEKIAFLGPKTGLSRTQLQRLLKAPTHPDFQGPSLDTLAALARAFETTTPALLTHGTSFTRDAAAARSEPSREGVQREPGKEALQRAPGRAAARSSRPLT